MRPVYRTHRRGGHGDIPGVPFQARWRTRHGVPAYTEGLAVRAREFSVVAYGGIPFPPFPYTGSPTRGWVGPYSLRAVCTHPGLRSGGLFGHPPSLRTDMRFCLSGPTFHASMASGMEYRKALWRCQSSGACADRESNGHGRIRQNGKPPRVSGACCTCKKEYES